MNLLAHCYVARYESPEFRTGCVLPDFIGMAGTRPNRQKLNGDLNDFSAEQAEVIRGMRFHYIVDGAYDRLDLATDLRKDFRDTFGDKYFDRLDLDPEKRKHLTKVWASLGMDMLLDGYLLSNADEAPGVFYEALAFVSEDSLAKIALDTPGTVEIMRRFEKNLPDYTDPSVVAKLIRRRVSHIPRLAYDDEIDTPLTGAFEEYSEKIAQVGSFLIDQVSIPKLVLPNTN